MRKRYFLFSTLVLSIGLSLPQTLRAQCMPNLPSNIPTGYVPFTIIYYISAPDEAGDLLVVGSMTAANYAALSAVVLPNAANQQYCNPITLAPGIVANAYVPTLGERTGAFGNFAGLLFDPTCVEACPYIYPSGAITPSEIPGVFAWRIPAKQPGPTVYVSTGYNSQILAVDGSSGVTSVLYTPAGDTPYYDLEGLTVGPDNLIYITDPYNYDVFRIPQTGGTLQTVYKYSEGSGPDEVQGPSFSTTGLLTFNTEDDNGVWQISFNSSDTPSAPVQVIPAANGAIDGAGTTYNHADELLIVDQSSSAVLQQNAPGASAMTPLITSTYLSFPVGVAVNSSGNIFVSNYYCPDQCSGYILQFDSAGNPLNTSECDEGVCQSPYVTFGSPDQPEAPLYMQLDASDRLYVVTAYVSGEGTAGKVYRVDPSGPFLPNQPAPTGMPTLLVDLGYAYSNGTIPNLDGNSAVGVALAGTGTNNSYTTPPLPLPSSGTSGTVTSTYGNIINQTLSFPSGWSSGGASFIEVEYQLWNPTLFDSTRLPAPGQSESNTWSGGTPVLAGTTCTPIEGTNDNCIVIEILCFDQKMNPIVPCELAAPSDSLIGLMSKYQTQTPQPYPGLIICDDGQSDCANITTGYSPNDPTIDGRGKKVNTDTVVVNLGQGVVSPASLEFGTVYLGTITAKSVTVSNSGNAPMRITDPFISIPSGGDSNAFVAVNLCPKLLPVGMSCMIDVTFFAGPNYAPQTAILYVMDSGPGSPQSVLLSATVINPQATLSSYDLKFGKQPVSGARATKAVTLTSTGATPLMLSTLTVTGNFALVPATAPAITCANGATLAPGASCGFGVEFTPTTTGVQKGSVVITDNARNSPQYIKLSGTGY